MGSRNENEEPTSVALQDRDPEQGLLAAKGMPSLALILHMAQIRGEAPRLTGFSRLWANLWRPLHGHGKQFPVIAAESIKLTESAKGSLPSSILFPFDSHPRLVYTVGGLSGHDKLKGADKGFEICQQGSQGLNV